LGRFDGILLVSELDGTLLDSNGAVSPGNRAALARFMAQGGRFAPATGRSPLSYKKIGRQIRCNAPCVFSNGSYLYDLETGRVLASYPMRGAYLELLDDALAWHPKIGIEVHWPDQKFLMNRNPYIDGHLRYVGVEGKEVAHYRDVPPPWMKILLMEDPAVLQDAAARLTPKYGSAFAFLFSDSCMLEIQNIEVDKVLGVDKLRAFLGIAPENTYVAGNAQNDLEMLRRFPSFAPANATPEAKAAARHIMPGNDEDTIAAAIAFIEGRVTE